MKLDPNFAEAYNNLAFTLRKQGSGNYKQSLAYYNKAIELKPKLAEAYMYRGVLYTQMGRKADAQADLASLKKLDAGLAKELEEYFETGKEEDYLYGATTKEALIQSLAVSASARKADPITDPITFLQGISHALQRRFVKSKIRPWGNHSSLAALLLLGGSAWAIRSECITAFAVQAGDITVQAESSEEARRTVMDMFPGAVVTGVNLGQVKAK